MEGTVADDDRDRVDGARGDVEDEAAAAPEAERPLELGLEELGPQSMPVDTAAEAREVAPPPPSAGVEPVSGDQARPLPMDIDVGGDDAWKERWVEALRPFLTKFAAHLGERGVSEHTLNIPVGTTRMMVSPEEQKLVVGFAQGLEPADRRALLLLFGVGLQVRIVADLRKLARVEGEAHEAQVKVLAADAELGYELQHELVAEAQMLTSLGHPELARALSDSQRRLTDRVTTADKVSGGNPVLRSGPKPKVEEPHRPEVREPPSPKVEQSHSSEEGQLGRGPVYDLEKMAAEAAAEKRQRAAQPAPPEKGKKGRGKPAKRPRDPKTEKYKLVCLAALGVALAVVLAHFWMNRPRELEEYALTDFTSVPCIEQVVNRAPVFLVVVSDKEWDGLSTPQREQVVRKVADVVSTAGYKRVEVRSWTRPALGEWTRRRGVTLQ